MSPKQILGSIVVAVLLGIFVYLLAEAFTVGKAVTLCAAEAVKCIADAREKFNQPMVTYLNSIGGLISAVVIAELAITKPTESPAARLFAAPGAPANPAVGIKIAVACYLAVWFLSGLSAFVWGSVRHPDAFLPLTDYGNSWFGLAIAAGYAYFGVNRS